VRQEHIASLGSVPPDMMPADRLAFWKQVHPLNIKDDAGGLLLMTEDSRSLSPDFRSTNSWMGSTRPPPH
jgi:hypothetical protein